MNIAQFTFNAFAENTFVVYDAQGACIIVDPGMSSPEEDAILFDFIEEHHLKPQCIVNTHCHIDHILGNASCVERYNVELIAHRLELPTLELLLRCLPVRPDQLCQFLNERERLRCDIERRQLL
jgi:glyoxylase-like metal-dependent hydrolase (beta-lactamase superfamily II)